MLAQPRKAYLLMGIEPTLDCADPVRGHALPSAGEVGGRADRLSLAGTAGTADCLLPITPFAETGGSFINCEGRLQAFNGVAGRVARRDPAGRSCA